MSAYTLLLFLSRARASAVIAAGALLLSINTLSAQPTARKQPPSIGEKLSEALVQLRPLQEAKNMEGMLTLLERVPGVQPGSYDDALILDMKARIFGMMEQPAKAIPLWERALQLSDEHDYFPERQALETALMLGQLHGREAVGSKDPAAQKEHFAKAVSFFRRYLAKTPKPPQEVMVNYTSILFYKGTSDPNNFDQAALKEAKEIVERGLTLAVKPREEFYQLLLGLVQQENDLVRASEVLELVLKQKPDKKDYWQVLAAIYVQLAEKAKETDRALSREYLVRAVVTFERARALGFLTGAKENLQVALLHLKADQFTKGTELLHAGLKKGEIESEPGNWRLLGRFYQEADLYNEAITVLDEATRLFPTNGEIEMQLAQLYLQQEKNAEALKRAQAATAKGNFEGTKPFSAYHLIAYLAFGLGQLEEAQSAVAAAEKFSEDAAKDAQFPKLKTAIDEAIETAEKAKTKDEKPSSAGKKPERLG